MSSETLQNTSSLYNTVLNPFQPSFPPLQPPPMHYIHWLPTPSTPSNDSINTPSKSFLNPATPIKSDTYILKNRKTHPLSKQPLWKNIQNNRRFQSPRRYERRSRGHGPSARGVLGLLAPTKAKATGERRLPCGGEWTLRVRDGWEKGGDFFGFLVVLFFVWCIFLVFLVWSYAFVWFVLFGLMRDWLVSKAFGCVFWARERVKLPMITWCIGFWQGWPSWAKAAFSSNCGNWNTILVPSRSHSLWFFACENKHLSLPLRVLGGSFHLGNFQLLSLRQILKDGLGPGQDGPSSVRRGCAPRLVWSGVSDLRVEGGYSYGLLENWRLEAWIICFGDFVCARWASSSSHPSL